jgi:hypothetical protein
MSLRPTKADESYARGFSDGMAAAAVEPIADDQVQRAWEAAHVQTRSKSFTEDPIAMIRIILEAGRG